MLSQSNKRSLNGLSLLSLIGLALAAYMSSRYYEIHSGTGTFKSFCNLNATFNCDAVASTGYAELFSGFPLSSFSAGWYLAIFFITLMAREITWKVESIRAIWWMNILSLVFSIYYAFLMTSIIKSICIVCLSIDVINLVMFFLGWTLLPKNLKTIPIDLKVIKSLLVLIGVCVGVLLIVLKGMDKQTLSTEDKMSMLNSVLNKAPVSIKTSPEFPVIGSPNAPVTIVKFGDFQCPACKMGAQILHGVLSQYPTQVRLVLRNYPLDPACNRSMQNGGHPFACEAARVARCAFRQGKYEAVYEALFENQASFAKGVPEKLAVAAGLNQTALTQCLADPSINLIIEQDIEEANALGIQATPTFFINGRKVDGILPLEVWGKIIDYLLKNDSH